VTIQWLISYYLGKLLVLNFWQINTFTNWKVLQETGQFHWISAENLFSTA